jgi:hypothetical protein
MINNRTSHEFSELGKNVTVAEARAKLVTGYGIVWDDNGLPITIIKLDDLVSFDEKQPLADIAGQLPPVIIVTAIETMEAFVQNPTFTAFSIGARGAIVYENEQVIGILTDETITRYLRDEFEPAGEIKGFPTDTTLPGNITDKPLIMYCDEFNHRNELAYYNRRKPPKCQVKEPFPHFIRKNK